MKLYQLISFIIIQLLSNYVAALSNIELRILYDAGQHQEAITQANQYLQSHANDGDVRLALAQFYFNEKKYQLARKELLIVLEQTPTYTDALLVLINCDIELGNYQEGLFMANYGLLLKPLDSSLLKKKADVLSLDKPLAPPYQVGVTPRLQIIAEPIVFPTQPTKPMPAEYQYLKALYSEKKPEVAIQRAITYLQSNPKDVDVRLVLGLFYFNQKEYIKAQKEVKQVVQQVPKYKDAILILINIDIQLKQFDEAKALAKQGLIYYPHDKMLNKKIEDIKNSQHPAPQKHLIQEPQLVTTPKTTEKKYHNEIGLYQQNYYINDVHQVWDYSTLFYGYEGELGKIFGKVNYNERLGFKAAQGEIEAIPRLTKNIYLDLQAAYAKNPYLFPSHVYGGELYVSIPKFFDISGGGKYNYITDRHQYTQYTGSLAKQYEKHRLSYRANLYYPDAGKTSLLNLIDYRYFIRDPNVFVGVMYGQGTAPDLADLATINFLITDNKIVSPYVNFALFHDRLLVNTSLYFQHQVFNSLDHVRNWAGGTLRLAWKY